MEMEEYYQQIRFSMKFLYETGVLSEGQLELLNLILWIYLKKHDFKEQEIFIYNEEWVNQKYFPECSKDEMVEYLGDLIGLGLIDHIIISNDITGILIKPDAILDLAQYLHSNAERNIEQLRSDLENAIINEDYETAALIRDQMQKIKG